MHAKRSMAVILKSMMVISKKRIQAVCTKEKISLLIRTSNTLYEYIQRATLLRDKLIDTQPFEEMKIKKQKIVQVDCNVCFVHSQKLTR